MKIYLPLALKSARNSGAGLNTSVIIGGVAAPLFLYAQVGLYVVI